ncbi:MAG: DUF1549 domain-containing protein [Acidobacteriia bacterium]|nr:DUF1549 domain-containing protein [Terriglobia bacterium]MYB52649.1 DUF1549 domain-containing protein [Terriglobia bacterium]MYK08911.1 DUF1549 domain-containing protein [Terriglobia bacterium]
MTIRRTIAKLSMARSAKRLSPAAALALAASLGAAPDAGQKLSPEAAARADQAHRTFEQPAPQASEIAESVTAQAGSLRPVAAAPSAVPRRNFIDEAIFAKIERDGVPHAGLAPDGEFLRRAYLDLVGRIPTLEEVLAFEADPNPNKRDRLIDELIDSEEFVERWAYYFEDLFRAGQRMGYGKNLFRFWVHEWLTLDRSYADVVTDLLTQGGKSSHTSPGALYFARDFVKAKDDPDEPDAHDLVNRADSIDEFTITYGKALLGLNLGCVSCHDGANHLEQVNLYLTGLTREDFFRQAAFFGKTRMIMNWENGFQANTEYTVDDVEPGYPTLSESIVRVPRTGGPNQPKFVLNGEPARPGALPRDELARLLTGHIQFARASVNRIWAELMGVGIVEPLDGFDLARYYPSDDIPDGWTVQPSHPYLLDDLAKDFQRSNFSLKHLVRTIAQSSAYQLSSRFDGQWKPEYGRYFARRYVKMLSPVQLHDSLVTATAVPGGYGSGDSQADMARQLLDPSYVGSEVAEFMRAFGQQSRDQFPARTPASSLQAMLMMNSQMVLDRVQSDGAGRVAEMLSDLERDNIVAAAGWRAATGASPQPSELQAAVHRGLTERLYLATLSRRPLEAELEVALAALRDDPAQGLENLQWALVNKPEFLFNY